MAQVEIMGADQSPAMNYKKKIHQAIDYNNPAEIAYRDGIAKQNAAEADAVEYERREVVDEQGSLYVIEDREDGPYVIATQKGDDQPIRSYGSEGMKLDSVPEDVDDKDVLDTVGEIAEGTARGVGLGVTNFVGNVVRAAVDNPIGDFAIGEENVEAFEKFSQEFLANAEKAASHSAFGDKAEFGDAGQIAKSVGEVAGQFVAPAAGLYKTMRAAGAGPLLSSVLADAFVGFAGVAPEDENVANLIPEDSEAFGALRELIATDPEDGEFVNRSKNAVEAMVLLGIGEAAAKSIIKTFASGAKAVKALELPEAIGKVIDKNIPKALGLTAGGAAMGAGEAQAGGPTAEEMQEALENGIPMDRDDEGVVRGRPDPSLLDDLQPLESTLEPEQNSYFETLALIESGNNPKARNKKSSAKGRYQFIDSTGKAFGLDKFKFGTKEYEVAEEAAVRKFTQQNAERLRSALGKEPTDGELYLAHQQGVNGAIRLLKNPLARAADIVGEKAVVNNGGQPDMKAWQFARLWTDKFKKKQKGIKTAAAGLGGFQLLADEMGGKNFELASGKGELITKAAKIIGKTDGEIMPAPVAQQARDALQRTGSAEGIDFNLSRMETSDQLNNLIDEISQVYKEPIDKAKGGVQTFDETQAKSDLARMTGFDVESVLSRQSGELWPAHKIKAARDIFVSELSKTEDLARAIKSGENTSENMIAFRRQLAVVSAVQSQIKGVQTETARALSQYRMTAKTPMEAQVNISELIQKSGGPEVNEKMVDAYLNVLENGGPEAGATFARNAEQVTGLNMLYEAWINSLLGSPATHAVNMLGNSLTIVQSGVERYAAATYGAVERGVGKAFGKDVGGITYAEANALVQGEVMSFVDAFKMMGKAFRTGESSDLFGKIDYHTDAITTQNINELPLSKTIASKMMQGDELIATNSQLAHAVDFMGEYYYRLPGRFLMAEDELFKTLNYRGELHALAAREAAQVGGDKAAQMERLNEILADPQLNAPELHQKALEFAREQTFTTPAGPIAQPVQHALGRFPGGRVIVPFFGVINNITKYVGGRVPGAALITPSEKIFNSKTRQMLFSKDPADRQLIMGRWATGSALLSFGAWGGMNGIITGRMSDNNKMVNQIEQTTKRKRYSMVIPGTDKMMNYNRLEPMGMLMAIAADTANAMAYAESEEERQNLALLATAAVVPYMEDKAFFSGVTQFMDALNPQFGDDEARINALGRYFTNLASSAPGAVLGPMAPNTPLSRNVKQNVFMDRAKRVAEANKWTIEKDKYGDDILVASGPEYRLWERTINKIFAGTPGLSDSLPADVNIWGEEIRYEGGLGPDIATPIYTNTPTFDIKDLKGLGLPDAMEAGRFRDMQVGSDITIEQHKKFVDVVGIDGELMRLNMPLSKPRAQISLGNLKPGAGLPVDLNHSDRIDLIKIMNNIRVPNDAHADRKRMNLKETLNWMIKQPEYAMLPDDRDATGAKGDIIRKVYNDYKKAAVALFFEQHPNGEAYRRRSIDMKLKAQNTGAN